jgi:hypothetical protein
MYPDILLLREEESGVRASALPDTSPANGGPSLAREGGFNESPRSSRKLSMKHIDKSIRLRIRALESTFGNCGHFTTQRKERFMIKETPRLDVVEEFEKNAIDPWGADIDPSYWDERDDRQDEE